MTLCPVAMAMGCRKCAAINFCPLKSVIGDFEPEDATPATTQQGAGSGDDKTAG